MMMKTQDEDEMKNPQCFGNLALWILNMTIQLFYQRTESLSCGYSLVQSQCTNRKQMDRYKGTTEQCKSNSESLCTWLLASENRNLLPSVAITENNLNYKIVRIDSKKFIEIMMLLLWCSFLENPSPVRISVMTFYTIKIIFIFHFFSSRNTVCVISEQLWSLSIRDDSVVMHECTTRIIHLKTGLITWVTGKDIFQLIIKF